MNSSPTADPGLHILQGYSDALTATLKGFDWTPVKQLGLDLLSASHDHRQVFICGNGGSAANAIHWANDFIYPIRKNGGKGIRFTSLSANQAVTTCLGNDIGYDQIFSYQLETLAQAGDLLIVLSGSGNSTNILNALSAAKHLGLKTYAILGFDGGKSLGMTDVPIHFKINDMQVAEDAQMIVCHMLTKFILHSREVSSGKTA